MLPMSLKTAFPWKPFLLLLLWMCYVKSEYMCPHGSYLHENICYMPRFDLHSVNYDDALDTCANVNGTLLMSWNAESMLFLRRLHWKSIRNDYWVGIVDAAIPKVKIFGSTRNKCITSIIYNGSIAWKPLPCVHRVEYICEFQGSTLCGHSKMVGNKCYRLEHELRTYSSANDDCRSKGGKLAEVRSVDELRFIEEEMKRDTTWENVTEIELNKINKQFPEIWLYSDSPYKLVCKTLQYWKSVNSSCSSGRPFICEIQGPRAATTQSTTEFKNETNHTNLPSFTDESSTITVSISTDTNMFIEETKSDEFLKDFNVAQIIESTPSTEKLDYTLIVVVPVVACFVIALLVIILLIWFMRCAPSKLRNSNGNIANRRMGSRDKIDRDGYLIALEYRGNSRDLKDKVYQQIPIGYDATDDTHYETID